MANLRKLNKEGLEEFIRYCVRNSNACRKKKMPKYQRHLILMMQIIQKNLFHM